MNASRKVALITGANKGLGFEIARQLIQAGCTVLLGARDISRGTEAAEKLKNLGDVRSRSILIASIQSIAL